MFGLMFKALTHRPDKNLLRQFKPPVVPAITREKNIIIDDKHLARYASLTGWEHAVLHPCYLQVLSLPLQLQCLAHKRSPFPLLGLVHRENKIRQLNHLDKAKPFEMRVGFSDISAYKRGWDVKMYARALQDNQLVYEAQATYLVKAKAPHVSTENNAGTGTVHIKPQIEYADATTHIAAPGNIGRRYAKLSGDANPIHLNALTAKPFGFPRAIAHGMWTLAMSVSHLYPAAPVTEITIDNQFKKPLLLPGQAQLKTAQSNGDTRFLLENADNNEPVITGVMANYFAL